MVKLDAGHNDAALHCLPTGELVVIDAGRGTAERLTEMVPPGSGIDHVPCTHPDEDHIKGMTDLLDDIDTEVHRSYHLPHFYVEKTDATRENDPPDEAYGAGNFDGLAGYLRSDTAVLRRFGEVVKETVDCSVEGIAGAEFPVEGGEATILFPYAIREDVETLEDVDGEADYFDEVFPSMSDDEFDTLDCESRGGVTKAGRNEHGESIDDQDSNNNSMVVRLSDGERIHLYTGDIESTAAEALADGYDEEELSADVLHAGHHGGTLHSVAFLDKVDPAVVIVSSELNGRYDRPDPRLLERGARRGISVAWTAAVSRDIGDRELEAAVDGDTQYDAWKLLKLRCVRRDERESTRDSLDETGEIVVAEYPLDRAAVDACDSGTEERAGEWGISADEMTGVRESPETEASGPFGDIPGVGEVKRAALRGAGIGSREERLGGG